MKNFSAVCCLTACAFRMRKTLVRFQHYDNSNAHAHRTRALSPLRTRADFHADTHWLCKVVVCCSVLCCSALQCVAVHCSMMQCVAVRCSALQCDVVCCRRALTLYQQRTQALSSLVVWGKHALPLLQQCTQASLSLVHVLSLALTRADPDLLGRYGCILMQRVAICFGVLQCVAAWCSVVWCGVLQSHSFVPWLRRDQTPNGNGWRSKIKGSMRPNNQSLPYAASQHPAAAMMLELIRLFT